MLDARPVTNHSDEAATEADMCNCAQNTAQKIASRTEVSEKHI